MTRSIPVGEIRPLGDRALLIGVEDAATGRALVSRLNEVLDALVDDLECEVVGGLATVMALAHDVTQAEQLALLVADVMREFGGVPGEAEPSDVGSLVTLDCVFDGPDLDQVAEQTGLVRDEVIGLLTAQPLTVAMLGFSPGFAFLGGLPDALGRVPRREQPRTVVPAGSVALANGFAAVYPSASPGGWHVVGRTGAALFSPAEAPYARLAAGDRVQLRAVTKGETAPQPWGVPAFALPAKARHLFTVVTPGLRTVLQDHGRRGVAAIGVPEAGPADPHSFALANRLVGNDGERAAFEITGQGPTLRVEGSGYITVVGASPQIRLDGQAVTPGQVIPVRPVQELVIGAVRPGLRTYLAAAGGFAGPRVLGSVATDQLSGLGPGPLSAGDAVYVETMIPPLADHLDRVNGVHDEAGGVTLRVLAGPHPEWFVPDVLARLADDAFVVAPESNRVGLRLRAVGAASGAGGVAPLRSAGADAQELDSQGMVHGAVQIPPAGDPVILMPDHATHGGYPVVAVVIVADLGRLGQCAAGDTVTFVPVDLAEAREARATQRRVFDRAVVGYYPLAVE
jgi:KipI family sensor histidine kinase inhibitor